jgi:preprotein translocase subunit YajC
MIFAAPVSGSILLDTNTTFVVSVLALLLLIIFFIYLILRRTFKSFKEGMDQGKR